MNRRGFIFSLDIILGTILLVAILGTSLFLLVKSGESSFEDAHLSLLGSDAVRVLDKTGILEGLDRESISRELQSMLPANVGMLVRVRNESGVVLEAGDAIPSDKDLRASRAPLLVDNSTVMVVEYVVWSR